jgi:hypothetical protein
MVVAQECGIASTATACAVGIENISTGVSRLPMPKPDTAATAPATTLIAPTTTKESTMTVTYAG